MIWESATRLVDTVKIICFVRAPTNQKKFIPAHHYKRECGAADTDGPTVRSSNCGWQKAREKRRRTRSHKCENTPMISAMASARQPQPQFLPRHCKFNPLRPFCIRSQFKAVHLRFGQLHHQWQSFTLVQLLLPYEPLAMHGQAGKRTKSFLPIGKPEDVLHTLMTDCGTLWRDKK